MINNLLNYMQSVRTCMYVSSAVHILQLFKSLPTLQYILVRA